MSDFEPPVGDGCRWCRWCHEDWRRWWCHYPGRYEELPDGTCANFRRRDEPNWAAMVYGNGEGRPHGR